LCGPQSPQHLPVNFVNFSILFLLFLDLLTERIDEFVPLRLPEIAGGSPKALQMPGIDIRNLYEFILHGVQPLCVLILLQLAFSRFFALFPRFLCALSLRCWASQNQLAITISGSCGKAQLAESKLSSIPGSLQKWEKDREGERVERKSSYVHKSLEYPF